MESIAELKRDANHCLRTAQDIIDAAQKEDRVVSQDEKTDVKTLNAKAVGLMQLATDREEEDAMRNEIAASIAAMNEPAKRMVPQMQPLNGASPPVAQTGQHHALADHIAVPIGSGRNLKCFTNRAEDAYQFGVWLAAKYAGAQWAQRRLTDLEQHSRALARNQQRALSETVNTAGGHLVPEEFAQQIIDLREDYGVFERETRAVPMTRDVQTIPRRTGSMSAAFIGEGDTITESDMTFDAVKLVAKKSCIITLFSSEVDEDSIVALTDLLADDMASAFALQIDNVGFNGAGTAADAGIIGITTKIEGESTFQSYKQLGSGQGAFSEVTTTHLGEVASGVAAFAIPNAKWYVSSVGLELVFGRLQQSAGGTTKTETGQPIVRAYNGYPIVVSQVLPVTTGDVTSGETMLLFGDLAKATTMGRRRGLSIETSKDRYFESDQIALRGIHRYDVRAHDIGSAATDATGLSPIAAMISNA